MHGNTNSHQSLIPYYSVLTLFWITAILLLVKLGYHESFLFLNKHHSPLLDPLVPHLTQFGDSLILSSLVLIFIPQRNIALAFAIVLSILLSGLVLVSLKHFVFPDWHRPLRAIGENAGIHYVKGYVEYSRAFPSGHTTTVFSAFLLFAFLFRQKRMQVLIAIAAVLFGYTRIYLGSHFLGDVLAGSALGTLFAIVSLNYIYPEIRTRMDAKEETVRKKYQRMALVIGIIGLMTGISVRYIL